MDAHDEPEPSNPASSVADDAYIDWPYATAYLLNTLDPELIEGHANHILSRALNIGRTVAFIGAGVSMSYGRMSWRSLVNSQVAAVDKKLAETIAKWRRGGSLIGEDRKSAFYKAHGHLGRLKKVLDELQGKDGLDVKADRYPMMFQLCEQLDKGLNDVRATECDGELLDDVGDMREVAMDLTIDQRGHARETLLKAFDALFPDGLQPLPEGCKEASEVRRLLARRLNEDCLQPYTLEAFQRLNAELTAEGEGSGWDGCENLREIAESLSKRSRPFLLPTERYLVGALSRLGGDGTREAWWRPLLNAVDETDRLTKRVKRQDLSPARRDPLMSLLERLQIHRFITTNYDHEIERLFGDRLFRDRGRSDDPESLLRPSAERIVFDNDSATRLMAFAVQDRGRQGKVVYLHGRASTGNDGRIIVTEADYQTQYLSPGDHRDMADDAIRLAFGGNPLLFVGSNMGEDDILRPLRQFMSTRSRVGDRVAIALVPAMEGRRKRVEEKIAHLGRYGVYTIHFGAAGLAEDIRAGCNERDNWTLAEADARSVEWLPWVWSIREMLLKRLAAVESACGSVPEAKPQQAEASQAEASQAEASQAEASQAEASQTEASQTEASQTEASQIEASEAEAKVLSDKGKAEKVWAETWSDLISAHELYETTLRKKLNDGLERTPAAERLRSTTSEKLRLGEKDEDGVARATGMLSADGYSLIPPDCLEGVASETEQGLCVDLDVSIINACTVWLDALNTRLEELKSTVDYADRARLTRRLLAEATAHRLALEGATDSLLAIFTCARLIRAHWQWDDWKRNWFRRPQPRLAKFSRRTVGKINYEHRHKIERARTPEANPSSGRFYDGAPAHSFYGLIAALEAEKARDFRSAKERRVLVVAGRRGVGKGHFFNALESVDDEEVEDQKAKDQKVEYQELEGSKANDQDVDHRKVADENADDQATENNRAAEGGASKKIPKDPSKFRQFLSAFGPDQAWHAAGFYNLSFAHEVMSVFDGIATFLHDERKKLAVPDSASSVAFESYHADRIRRLEAALGEWVELARDHPGLASRKRVMIAINSLGMLFDQDGNPKNGQVKRLFNTLLDPRFDGAPIDFVLVCQDTNLPVNFRGGRGRDGIRPLILPRPTDNAKSAASADYLYRAMGIDIGSDDQQDDDSRLVDIDWRSPEQRRMPQPWKSTRVTVSADRPATPEVSKRVAVHLIHETRASVLTTAYFPRIALLMGRQILREQPGLRHFLKAHHGKGDPVLPDIFEPHATAFRNTVRILLNRLRPDGLENGVSGLPPKIAFPAAMILAWLLVETVDFDGKTGLEVRFKRLVERLREIAGPAGHEINEDVLRELIHPKRVALAGIATRLANTRANDQDAADLQARLEELFETLPELEPLLNFRAFAKADRAKDDPEAQGALVRELLKALGAFDKRMQDLHHAVGGSRMLLTLIMAGAYEITTDLTKRSARKAAPTLSVIKEAAERVERYFERAKLALRGVPDQRRSDIVIDTVVSLMRRHHDRGAPLPLELHLMDPDAHSRARASAGPQAAPVETNAPTLQPAMHGEVLRFFSSDVATPAQFELMMEVIWHLSVIGQPVETDVLAWCPRIQAACRKLAPKFALDFDHYRHCVREILDLAVNRCLVFRLAPEGAASETDEGDSGKTGPKQESPDPICNPDDQRRRYAVHRQIQRYVFEKLGAPSVEFTDADQFTLSLFATQPDDLPRLGRDAHVELSKVIEALSGYPGVHDDATRFRSAEKGLQPRLLRAAFGIMRSVYSVAVLARFSDPGADSDGAPGHEGYFEQHRRRVRWLIRAAVDAKLSGKSENGADAPFYAEEIVWLYNECAVLSLVQGKLSDAQALLDTALAAARDIEPDDDGALHVRLRLNKAVVDIERGQAASAKRFLERIAGTVGEHPIPPLIATGYLGLIAHLAGEVDTALAHYDKAIAELTAHRRSRGASIFSRHRGDLLRNLQTPRVQEARQAIENALNLALAGAHEDIRHMAVLSLVKHRVDHAGPNERPDLHRQLDEVERYARSVGMPRLLCDASLLRASLLLTQGETRLAGSLVSQALEVASMNDLRLYKVKGLLLLAQITRLRGLPAAAQPLHDLGERMAKAADNHFVLSYTAAQTSNSG